ncbi:ficolin-1-like [Uranotaenia lowii]|uniref:ficolin-1-like n=1 Tax=Uranotaenia lowii TaxID=190385 RepID=UPI002478FA59|nr:ficolin-1-like [Uranotaenia lowii]
MLIKRLKTYLVALILCGSGHRCSIVKELSGTQSLDTINFNSQNVSPSWAKLFQAYKTDMDELKDQGRDIKQVLRYLNEKKEEALALKNVRTCFDVRNLTSGIYHLQPQNGFGKPFEALCDNDYSDGGWTVIQYRFNGSVDFYRGWGAYEEGFGDLEGEFWLGLEKIHQLTYSKRHELHVILEDFEGNSKVAQYDDFRVTDKAEMYKLKSLGQYNGTAGNSLNDHRDQKFTTFDVDNDQWYHGNCANLASGAWWYNNCGNSNLNGRYLGKGANPERNGMYWRDFHKSLYSLKSSRMMIRVKA